MVAKGEVLEPPLLMCLALLELERGGDLLIESPSKGSHHASSQHSWGQAFSKPTHSPFPAIWSRLSKAERLKNTNMDHQSARKKFKLLNI